MGEGMGPLFCGRSISVRQRKIYIKTFGCQMNEHDSSKVLEILHHYPYEETDDLHEADLIFINTCTVREKAEHKAYSTLGRLKGLKKEKKLIIGVGGCLAQQKGADLLERFPHLDFVLGTHNLHRLPDVIEDVQNNGSRWCENCFRDRAPSMEVIPLGQPKAQAYVTIMQGCDNFCSYCIVPMVRGPERSRPSLQILEEVRCLAEGGVKEIILLGQNVNSYGKGLDGEMTFPALLRAVSRVEGIRRIRFTTSHPKDLSLDLIACFRDLPGLCEHLHLPFQSGSNRVLKAMNRGYTREAYVEKVDRLREACPDMAITADVLVGFPGEGEKDFDDTMDLIERVRFDGLFSFRYSAREGTAAADFPGQIPEAVKGHRLKVLQERQRCITRRKNEEMVGKIERVLVEGRSQRNPWDMMGRTRTNRIVNFPGDGRLVGEEIWVRIVKGFANSLRGEATPSRPMVRAAADL
jgi:tRNA-2-methylthio-N6-dimethylallyladenosine synthase